MNCPLMIKSWCWLIEVLQVKYIHNLIEQGRRFIKRITRHIQIFKTFNSAASTLSGIEVAHMIRNGQCDLPKPSGFAQFGDLAG